MHILYSIHMYNPGYVRRTVYSLFCINMYHYSTMAEVSVNTQTDIKMVLKGHK